MTAPLRAVPDRYEVYRVVTDLEALHEAFRDRVEDMDASRLEIDEAAGLTPGYASKLLSDPPMKFVGLKTLPKILKGTRLKIALIEDNGQAMPDVPKRKYRIGRLLDPASMPAEMQNIPINLEELVKNATRARMREIGMKGNKSPKRKARALKRAMRQRVASHAARKRWSKGK